MKIEYILPDSERQRLKKVGREETLSEDWINGYLKFEGSKGTFVQEDCNPDVVLSWITFLPKQEQDLGSIEEIWGTYYSITYRDDTFRLLLDGKPIFTAIIDPPNLLVAMRDMALSLVDELIRINSNFADNETVIEIKRQYQHLEP